MAVTRVLHRQGRLARYVTNVGFGDPDLGGRRAVPAALSRLMSQKVLRGLPSTDVSHVGVLSELAHLAMRRVPGGAAAASRRMYTSKRVFDAHLARSLNDVRLRTGATVVLGMYGSASRTFEQAHRLGMKTVLNFVNSEPRTQNALLAKYAALPSEHHEMIPAHVAVEVEREIGAADLILVPSAFVRDQLRRLGVPDGRLALIRYGVDLAAFGGSVERADASPDSPLRALFLGQVAFRKGIPTLLDAMRGLIGQVELEIRGPVTSPELLDDLPSNCRYVGTSSHQDLPGILARADVLVLPSYEDSFALVVTEAMAAGVPAVVSTNAGASEGIIDGKTGLLVAPGDAEALRGHLSALGRDREWLRRLGADARAATTTYDWDEYGAEVLSAIDMIGD